MNYDISTFMGTVANEYLFAYHQTHENGTYHIAHLGVPIVAHGTVAEYPGILTERVSLSPHSVFRIFQETNGIQYEAIMLPPTTTYMTCTGENYEQALSAFLEAIHDKVHDCEPLKNICKTYHPELYI